MRVIVANHFPVLPARGGGQLAVLGLTAQLAAGWPTELVWTERKRAASHRVTLGGRTVEVTVVPNLSLQRKVARWLKRWTAGVDNDIGTLLCAGANRRLLGHLRHAAQDGDVVVAEHPWLWPALRPLQLGSRCLLVYDAHNVEHQLKEAAYPASPVAELLLRRVRSAERELVRYADLVLACTARDAAALSELAGIGPEKVLVGSKGIDPSAAADAMALARRTRQPGRSALFVGSAHPPNNEAARWIADVLAPACPEWQFVVAGACGAALPAGRRAANLRVTGVVDQLGPLLAEADVALNPMLTGSGINMKLFEALQCGLPVLSTALGARGFESVAPNGIVLAERDGFAAALRSLVGDAERWRRLGTEGAACIRAHYEWPVVGARVRARIESLLAERKP